MIKKGPLAKSFVYAFHGVARSIKTERNMKIHCVAAVLVVIAGFVLRISYLEWCVCLALIGLVMGLEMTNTALEAAVDLVTEGEHKVLAGRAKDAAAGAVLIAAIFAAICGGIIFFPKIYVLFT